MMIQSTIDISLRKTIYTAIFYCISISYVASVIFIGFATHGELKKVILVSGISLAIILFLLKLCYDNCLSQSHDLMKLDVLGLLFIFFSLLRWVGFIFTNSMLYIPVDLLIFSLGSILYLLLKNMPSSFINKKICYVAFIFTMLGVIEALVSFWQFFFWERDFYYKTVVNGTLLHSNFLGAYFNISLGACFFLFIKSNRVIYKCVYLLCGFVVILGLMSSASRGAILSCILSFSFLLLCYLYRNNRSFFRKVLLKYCVLLCAISCFFIFMDKKSSQGRWMKLQVASLIIADNFLSGVGEENYSHIYLDYQRLFLQKKEHSQYLSNVNEDSTTNNQLVKYFIEHGAIGFLLFTTLIFFIIRKIIYHNEQYVYFVSFSLLCLVFHMLFDEIFKSSILLMSFVLLCSFLPSTSLKGVLGKVLTLLCNIMAILILIVSFNYISKYQSLEYYIKADSALKNGDYINSSFFLKQVIEKYPTDIDAQILLGRCLVSNEAKLDGGAAKIQEGIIMLERLKKMRQSRDLYLALSLGYLKLEKYDVAFKYAQYCHTLFPLQVRPILLLYLISNESIKYSSQNCDYRGLLLNKLQMLNIDSLDKGRIKAIINLIIENISFIGKTDFRSFQIRNLLNLVILSH